MSKIRVLIYKLDIHNLQTKTVSFPDQQKFLKEVVVSLAVYMNANTVNSQINIAHAQNILLYIGPTCKFTGQKKHLKNDE